MRVFHEDIQKNFDIVVMYNKDHHFYAKIPVEFKDILDHLSDAETQKFEIFRKWKSKSARFYANSKDYDFIITSETEEECLEIMKKCLMSLIGKSIKKRDVIIVFFNPDYTCQYNEHKYNKDHPQIGLQFGITYAVESTVGDKKVYAVYTKYNAFNEERINRQEINLWNKAATIIPDTEENRFMLEQLYQNLQKLTKKLTEFTKTPEDMIKFITSNVKMLT